MLVGCVEHFKSDKKIQKAFAPGAMQMHWHSCSFMKFKSVETDVMKLKCCIFSCSTFQSESPSRRTVISSWRSIRVRPYFCILTFPNILCANSERCSWSPISSERCTFDTFVWFKERTKSMLCTCPSLDVGLFLIRKIVSAATFVLDICLLCRPTSA